MNVRKVLRPAAALLVLLLAACGGAAGPPAGGPGVGSATTSAGVNNAGAPKSGGVLNFGLSSYPPNLNPYSNTGTAARTVKLSIHRGLLGYNAKGELQSELAESWERQGDTVYVVKLRKNAKFHNGDPVTADDVKFSFGLIMDKKNAAYLYDSLQVIQSIDVVDPQTAKITLKAPSASFLAVLADPEGPIISHKSTIEDPMGAGPFVLKQAEKGVKVEVTKFKDYYKPGRPYLDGIKFVVYADENPRVAALQTGDMDLIEYVPWKDMATIEKDPKLKMDSTNGPFMYLIFNVTSGPFAKAEVRRAMGYAINRDNILQGAFFGRGGALYGIPMAPPYDNDKLAHFWSYDPNKAKQLLAEAGYPNGFEATLLSTSQYGMHQDTAQVVQNDLEKIGVKVKLNLPDWPTRIQLGNKGQYEFAIMGSAGRFNDPDWLSDFAGGSDNYARSFGYKNAKLQELMDAGRKELDQAKRKQIYDQVQQLTMEDGAWVPLCTRAQAYAYQKYVQGFANLPGFLTFHSGLMLDSVSLNK